MSSKGKSSAETGGRSVLMPKLRFPEFEDAGAWNSRVIGDFLDESRVPSNLNDPSKRITVRLHLQGVEHREHRGTESLETTNNFLRKSGQFIYGKQNIHKGAFGIIPSHLDGFETSQDIPSFDFKATCNPVWFFYHLSREEVYSHFELKMTGTGSKRLNERTFLSLPIDAPKYPEQQKIADCLASADALIAAQGRKVEALRAHKKGLMQQLFPQEGATQPRLRFPEFRDSGDWETKLGGELFANRKEKGKAGLPIYSVTMHDGMVPRSSFDRNFYDIKDPAGNRKAHRGDIAYNMMRMWQGALGTAPEDCLVSPAYVVLKPRSGACPEFFAYFFKLPQSLQLLTITSRGLTKDRLRLYFDDFAKMPLRVPEKPEQQRIADCLTSLDTIIVSEARKLDTLKTHKKGLMQQLFPSVAEAEA